MQIQTLTTLETQRTPTFLNHFQAGALNASALQSLQTTPATSAHSTKLIGATTVNEVTAANNANRNTGLKKAGSEY